MLLAMAIFRSRRLGSEAEDLSRIDLMALA
jgi:hypothetical protein